MENVMMLAFLAATALSLCATADDPKDAGQKDLNRLQGDWAMVSGRQDGIDTIADAVTSLRCTVRGTDVKFLRDGKVVEQVTIKLDPSKKPKVIDATLAKDKVAPGIYMLDDALFTLCYAHPGKNRPIDFKAKEGSGHSLSVWKKVKK
jgi:uncharacterized protein (TIGR03067 family)